MQRKNSATEWEKYVYKVYFEFVGDPEVEPTTYKRNDMAIEYPDSNARLFAEKYFKTAEEAMEFINTSKHKSYSLTPLND